MESNNYTTHMKENFNSLNLNSYQERNFHSKPKLKSVLFPKQMYVKYFILGPSQELPPLLNENGRNNICSESKFFTSEQINKKEDFKSSAIINNKSYEKSEEKEDNLVIDLSSLNDNISNYCNTNTESNIRLNDSNELNNTKEKNKIFFINKKKKRKTLKEKNKKYPPIFTPSEDGNDLRKLINEVKNVDTKMLISNENSDAVSCEGKRKKKKNITSRKYNTDNVNKRIKTNFFKQLKINTNLILKSADCKKRFTYLQPSFINNTNKNMNKKMFEKKFKDFLLVNIMTFMKDKKTKNADNINYEHNISVLEHLKRNKYYFDFLDKTIIELFIEYFNSREFEMKINDLKNNKKEDIKYIKYYISKANNFINYFSSDESLYS